MRRRLRSFAATRAGSWLFARILQRLDEPVLRATRGRANLTSFLAGLPVIVLTTTGARSGEPRSVPLVGLRAGSGTYAVIASNFGQRHHPAWSYNLRAHPDATITVAGRLTRVRASIAEGDQREVIWRQALEVYPGYAAYERRAAHRGIAVWVLHPATAA
ncbi:MAG TPA: nitroreductase/quinone reductase family protein [Solirubrobacteraceae bacterium]|nr:nitroreductase/quinone reductase family protein [Solirubrobacteraceae bacterium]